MATDQEIRDSGLKYIPQQKYLQNPYNLPIAPVPPPVNEGIVNTNAFANSGGGEKIRYDNSFLPDPPTFNYVDTVRKYGPDSKQAQQMLTKAGATYPGGFQSNEGGFEYTNSFPNNSIQMENLNNNRFSTIEGQNNVFDVNVQGDPALNRGSKMAQGDDPYSEKAFEEEEDKQSFIAKMISKAKQAGSALPGWAKTAATAMGGPFAAAASFLGNVGGKSYEQFDPRGNIKGGVYTIDGVNYANPGQVNESYDNDPSSPTYGTNRFDRAEPGSFASYRTLKDFFESKRDNKKDTGPKNTGTKASGDGGKDKGSKGSSKKGSSSSTASYGQNFHAARGGRAGYFFGGRVNYKAGGRTGYFLGGNIEGGYSESQKDSGKKQTTTSYSGGNNDGASDNPPNFFVEDKTSIVDTSGLKSKSPEINIDYTDPRNYASLKSRIYNTNILDNDNINVDGTLSGEIGQVSYDTSFTDKGITNTNLKAGKFNADIDANKNYNIGYANNYNGIDYGAKYDGNGNLMFTAGVNFKNGGLAGLL